MKSTIRIVYLTCTQCASVFPLSKHDYIRRLHKLSSSNFFCTRKCCAAWRVLHSVRPPNSNPTFLRDYRTQHNITNKKYDSNFIWYANRIASDSRSHVQHTLSRSDVIALLDELWVDQKGECAMSGMPLERRVNHTGVCATSNPFFIASVDRIDSNKPYCKGNLQWISLGMNLAKQTIPHALFQDYVSEFKESWFIQV